MPVEISVKVNEAQALRVQAELAGISNGTTRAIVAGINRTLGPAVTRIRRRVSGLIGLPVGRLRKRIKPLKANYKTMVGKIRLRAINVKLSELRKKNPQTGKPYALGAFDTPRVLAHKPFRATMKSGHASHFVRKSKRRLPIDELRVASPAALFETAPGFAAEELANIGRDLEKNIDSQVDRLLKRPASARPTA